MRSVYSFRQKKRLLINGNIICICAEGRSSFCISMSYCVSNFKGTEDRDLYICLPQNKNSLNTCLWWCSVLDKWDTQKFCRVHLWRLKCWGGTFFPKQYSVANGAAVKTVLGYLLTPYSQNTTAHFSPDESLGYSGHIEWWRHLKVMDDIYRKLPTYLFLSVILYVVVCFSLSILYCTLWGSPFHTFLVS